MKKQPLKFAGYFGESFLGFIKVTKDSLEKLFQQRFGNS